MNSRISEKTEIEDRKTPLKLGLFWPGALSREIELAIRSLASANTNDTFEQLMFFTDQERSDSTLFVRETTKYPYNTINDLEDVFNQAHAMGLDFALVSFGNGVPTSLARLATLFLSEPVEAAIWSFRVCVMTGVGFRHWPRLPNVDDHFIVLNVRRAAKSRFFERKLINASHFSQAGGRQAEIMSMIEYSMEKGEFTNHFVAEASMDQYGNNSPFNSMPFHLCESTGFLCCYSDFNPALYRLLEKNLSNQRQNSTASANSLRYINRAGFSYFRKLIDARSMFNVIKRPFNLGKFEFQKTYQDEK